MPVASREMWAVDVVHEHGPAHPASIVQSKSLSFAPPPKLEYNLHRALSQTAGLSAFQRETVERACQSLESSNVFFLGDGTGTGKGRILAAIASETIYRRRTARVLWLSANRGLGYDANRDLAAIGLPSAKSIDFLKTQEAGKRRGESSPAVLFCTYGLISHDDTEEKCRLIGNWFAQVDVKSRLILLDEAHLLRRRSKGAVRVQSLVQRYGAGAGLVYSTATLASHATHLHFIKELCGGESGIDAIQRGGQGAMELLAVDMKARGVYLSRQLNTSSSTTRCVCHALTETQIELYDQCSECLEEVHASGPVRQLFFRALVASFKVDTVLREANEALSNGMSVVIGIQQTGDAAAQRASYDTLGYEIQSSMRDAMQRLGADLPASALPRDAIDVLFEGLGGRNCVAEITGRRLRYEVGYGRKRLPSTRNEIHAFQSGEKRVAIISRAGSTGISLHSDDQQNSPRMHILLELPWSAEDYLQMCGRTFRASSTTPAHYVIVTCALPVDARVGVAIHHRLRWLGAITRGDRFACDSPIPDELNVDLPLARRRALVAHAMLCWNAKKFPNLLQDAEIELDPVEALRTLEFHCNINPVTAVCATLDEVTGFSCARARRIVALAVAAMKPMSLLWIKGSTDFDWRREPGALPDVIAAEIKGVKLAAGDTQTLFSLLPESVIDVICSFAAKRVDVDAATLHDSMSDALGCMHMFVTQPLSWTLNRLMTLPVQSQTDILKLMAMHRRVSSKTGGVKDLCEMILTPSTEVESIVLHRSPEEICVAVKIRKKDPFPVEEAWRLGVNKVAVSFDNVAKRVCIRACTKAKDEQSVWLREWDEMVERGDVAKCSAEENISLFNQASRAALRTARTNSGRYIISTKRALLRWQESQKTVVSCTVAGETVTGLYIRKEPL